MIQYRYWVARHITTFIPRLMAFGATHSSLGGIGLDPLVINRCPTKCRL